MKRSLSQFPDLPASAHLPPSARPFFSISPSQITSFFTPSAFLFFLSPLWPPQFPLSSCSSISTLPLQSSLLSPLYPQLPPLRCLRPLLPPQTPSSASVPIANTPHIPLPLGEREGRGLRNRQRECGSLKGGRERRKSWGEGDGSSGKGRGIPLPGCAPLPRRH